MAGRGARRGSRADAPRESRRRTGLSLVASLALATVAGASHAGTLADAQAAFDRGQFARAADTWRDLARAGEPEAAFRLGLVNDLGLGRAADPVKAFRWYLEAAHRGHAAAQFNVGVMLDAGTGTSRSPPAAATWYARAAAKRFARAEYNLALLYTEDEGLPRNVGLARAWMARAASTLPAARERLEALGALEPDGPELPVAPVPLAAATVSAPGGNPRLELVWTADEQPPGTRYRVELDGGPGGLGVRPAGRPVEVSAVSIALPAGEIRRWRVLATDGEGRTAASAWQSLTGDEVERAPERTVTIRFGADDAPARVFADELARVFARDGMTVETATVGGEEIAESEVLYFSGDDASLARRVSTVLPVLAGRATFRPDPERAAGSVEVRLRGGPSP